MIVLAIWISPRTSRRPSGDRAVLNGSRLKPDRCLETRLLPLVTGPGGFDKEWFFVAPEIRGPIREEIRDCLVYPFYSELHRGLFLWIVAIHEGNAWFESLRRCSSSRSRSTAAI